MAVGFKTWDTLDLTFVLRVQMMRASLFGRLWNNTLASPRFEMFNKKKLHRISGIRLPKMFSKLNCTESLLKSLFMEELGFLHFSIQPSLGLK